jgi:hypothetical protein
MTAPLYHDELAQILAKQVSGGIACPLRVANAHKAKLDGQKTDRNTDYE